MLQATRPLDVDPETWHRRLHEELDRWLSLLETHVDARKVILFGSVARGKARLWSDVDLVVVAPTSDRFLDRTKAMLRLLEPRVGLDVLVYTPEEFSRLCRERSFFRDEVLANGIVLYERSD